MHFGRTVGRPECQGRCCLLLRVGDYEEVYIYLGINWGLACDLEGVLSSQAASPAHLWRR